MKLTNLFKNRVVKNAGWLIAGRLTNKVLAFIVSILTARYLGPGNYGLIGYVAAYMTFFTALCSLGINSVIIKDFVDHPEQEGEAIGTTLVLRLVSSFLSALMIVGIVAVVDKGEPTTVLVAALSSIGLLFQIFDTMKRWFQARLQSKFTAIATVIGYLIVSGYKLLLLITNRSVGWFALATAVEYMVEAAMLLIAYKKNGGPRFSFSFAKARQLLTASSGYIMSDLMISIYISTDKLMLKQFLDEASVGYYTMAVSVSNMWTFLLEAVKDSIYPTVIRAYDKGEDVFNRRNRQLYALVLYSALAVSALICLLAKPIVSVMYGQAYLPAVLPLQIVVWYTAFSYLGSARSAWIVCHNKQKYLKYLYIGGVIINVVLNSALIPVWGVSGAALASLVTQICTTAVLPALLPPLRPNAKLMLEALMLKDILPKK